MLLHDGPPQQNFIKTKLQTSRSRVVSRRAAHSWKMTVFCDGQSETTEMPNQACGNAPFKLVDRQSVIMLLIPHAIKKRTIRRWSWRPLGSLMPYGMACTKCNELVIAPEWS